MTSFKLEGGREMDRKLRRLDKMTQRDVAMRALTAGGEVIAEEARIIVEVKSGNLRDSITVSDSALNFSAGRATGGRYEVFVGPEQGRGTEHDGFYGHMVENGTYRSAAFPFMTPAFENKADEAMDAITASLRSDLANV